MTNSIFLEKPLLIIMAKWPAYGRCKSRLSEEIGKKNSAIIQKYMFYHTISVAKYLESNGSIDICLAISGVGMNQSKKLCKELGIKKVNLQGNGCLGQRMKRQIILNQRFYRNFAKQNIIIIGTDLPDLCHTDVLQAKSKLNQSDIVLGPSDDGGYWLIGLSKNIPMQAIACPFINIQWSCEDVLRRTIENLKSKNLKIDYLTAKVDIDRLADIEKKQ